MHPEVQPAAVTVAAPLDRGRRPRQAATPLTAAARPVAVHESPRSARRPRCRRRSCGHPPRPRTCAEDRGLLAREGHEFGLDAIGFNLLPVEPGGAQIVSQFIPFAGEGLARPTVPYLRRFGTARRPVRPARPRGLHVGPELPGHPSPSPDILEAALSRPPAVAVRLGGLERPVSRGPEPPPSILACDRDRRGFNTRCRAPQPGDKLPAARVRGDQQPSGARHSGSAVHLPPTRVHPFQVVPSVSAFRTAGPNFSGPVWLVLQGQWGQWR